MLIDEPSIGLSPRLVQETFAILHELRAKGMSILMVEQNAKRALEISDYGIVIELGRTRMAGGGARHPRDPKVGQLFLGGGLAADAAEPRYSITRSTRASSAGGILMPSAVAGRPVEAQADAARLLDRDGARFPAFLGSCR
jgi:energy-coupling factor transporter ATP-binding protein EcfA2